MGYLYVNQGSFNIKPSDLPTNNINNLILLTGENKKLKKVKSHI